MTITLSKPPTLNKLYGINDQGRRYMSPEGMNWKMTNGWILKALNIKLSGQVYLWITLYTATHQDNDSILKILQDTIQSSGIIKDDFWIFDLRVKKEVVKKSQQKIEIEMGQIK